MINVAMTNSAGMTTSTQVNNWEDAYNFIKETDKREKRQPYVMAFVSESHWVEDRYEVDRGEYFFRGINGLVSAGFDTDVQIKNGKVVQVS